MAARTRSRPRPRPRLLPDDFGDAVVGRLPRPVATIVRKLRHEDVFMLAAGLAFYALVSVAPFAILALWVVSLIAGDDSVHTVADHLAKLLPAHLGAGEALERVAQIGASSGIWALVALLWPATAYGAGLSRAFVRLCPGSDPPAKGLRGRALALALVGLMPVLALAGLLAAYAGTTLAGKGGLATLAGLVLGLALGFAASAAAAAAIYKLFSPRPIPPGGLLKGAAVAGGAVAVLSVGYAVFLNSGADFENRYATSGLAAVVLLAVWLFLANALILVGYQVALEVE